MSFRILNGDCIDVMNAAKQHSCDAIITDPPYGIEFAGNTWDSPKRMVGTADGAQGGFHNIAAGLPRPDMDRCDPRLFQQWCEQWGIAALRVLKPGAHLFAFGSPRMYHRMVAGLEDAGFEIRDMIAWIHGEGFAKAKKIAGHDGWKTPCLKPALEPILVARAPKMIPGKRAGTMRKASTKQNMDVHGVGGFHIDAARVGEEQMVNPPGMTGWNDYRHGDGKYPTDQAAPTVSEGRFPSNVLIDEQVADELGARASYFYVTKSKGAGRPDHPTVKPTALMDHLIALAVPDGGQILDPFCGSGSTGVAALQRGCRFIGIEMDERYAIMARGRCANEVAARTPRALGEITDELA